MFSDGNCAATVTYFDSDLSNIESVVDWGVMQAQMWANTADDPDRRRRRMAESRPLGLENWIRSMVDYTRE